jgi:hypothetical protein
LHRLAISATQHFSPLEAFPKPSRKDVRPSKKGRDLFCFGDEDIGAGWSSPVARQAHNLKVVGSNPTPATNPYLDQPWRLLSAPFVLQSEKP